ncbi:MAG: SpoIIE family protein phosphatase, partial [bacterium]|nr:SpoIIE family protein phosphatase [bacterium]
MRYGLPRLKRWLLLGLVLASLLGLSVMLTSESTFSVLLSVALGVWVVLSLAVLLRRFWRWLTYRIGMRLFLSYLLIGVSPLLLGSALVAFCCYVAMGQYTSVRYGSETRVLAQELGSFANSVLDIAALDGDTEAIAFLRETEENPESPFQQVLWLVRFGSVEHRSAGAEDLEFPAWLESSREATVVRDGSSAFLLAGESRPEQNRVVVGLIPLNANSAQALNSSSWYDVYFFPISDTVDAEPDTEDGVNLGITVMDPEGTQPRVHFDEGSVKIEDVFADRSSEESASWLDSALIYWFRVVPDVRDLATGEVIEGRNFATLLRTSPKAVWNDFTASGYELAEALQIAFFIVVGFFSAIYLSAVAIAAIMIFSITRSTTRLTHGAKAVGDGNLGHRIPVSRRDQLGDLALSFNQMTESVQSMLSEVAEKERLAGELELAREIQESLLPKSRLRHGPIEINATFRPAAEVGGDYWDVFPLDEDRIVLTIGDVAGHGLPTGLLMAMLKSSVASLVHEGYRGEVLVRRLNEVLQEQGQQRMMATLMIAEIDLAGNVVKVTNAGHPPAYLLLPDGTQRELASGALPLGGMHGDPATGTFPLKIGASIVFYSDGLVEASGNDGEPFGYDALAATLKSHRELTGGELQTE